MSARCIFFRVREAITCTRPPAEDVWDSNRKRTFAYDFASTLIVDQVARPLLQFTAPELAGSISDAPVTGKADVFSLACVTYQLLRKQPLITAETTSEYRNMLASIHLIPVDGLPASLQARISTAIDCGCMPACTSDVP